MCASDGTAVLKRLSRTRPIGGSGFRCGGSGEDIMRNNLDYALAVSVIVFAVMRSTILTTAQPAVPRIQNPAATQTAQPAVEEWSDDFEGNQLDEKKWEPYTFEGGGGGKIEVKDKQLKMRGSGGLAFRRTQQADVPR